MASVLRVIASALCFTGIAAAAVYALQTRWVDTAVLMLVGLGQVLCFLTFRTAWAKAAGSLILLIAGISAAQLLYERIPLWDLVIHLLATAVLTALLRGLHLRRRASGRSISGSAASEAPAARRRPAEASTARRVGACTLAGLALAVVWEVMEVVGSLLVTPEIHNPPLDTALDIVAGVVGAAVVGLRRAPL